jgi:endonuclease/exonuclease/phosphatase family metal-dependent hydrolase
MVVLGLWLAPAPAPGARRVASLLPAVFALALLSALVTAALTSTGRLNAADSGNDSAQGLRVMTYNIQQGYDTRGEKAYAQQLALIRAQTPDILGLQESDTARIANGSGDVVRYLSDGLDMHAYYGPTTVTGTFGIALLSRYPIEDPRTFFMYSKGEQTAAILATIRVDGQAYTVLVTHLGSGGPLIQQQQVLERLTGQSNVIAMGDFNFNPSKEQYSQTVAEFNDAWAIAGEQIMPPQDFDISRRIDHVFLSPNLRASRATYLAEGPSDHPALVVEIIP